MSAKKEKNVKEKKKISLTSMIFIALIAGAITGMVLHYLVPDSSVKNDVIVEGVLYVLGQGFIRLMKMLVVPLVFCSLVCGSMAIGDTKKLGNVGGKTLAFYLVTTAVAELGERAETVSNFISQFNDIMMEMTMMVMSLAPIGVFSLIARTFATIGFSAFVPLAKYMIAVLIALAIQCFGIYQILLKLFTGLNPVKFIRKFFPVMAFAFSTATSNATIPLSIDTLYKKMGVSKKISSFTIPLGATINMDGTSIMQGVAVMFAAQAFGIQLTPMDYVTVIGTATLASIGTAGIPSVGLVTLTMVFNSVGLPVEAIGIIMGIDRILDMARTAVNITGDAVCTTIVACQNGAVDKEVFNKAE